MKNILMRMQQDLHKMFRAQSGSAMVITTLAMVALMGFSALVVDMGSVYYVSSKLQNALDSAALGAVRELPAASISSSEWAAAKSEAIALAGANHFSLSPEDVHPIYKNGDSTQKIIGIQVTKSTEVQYSFARVLGIDSGTVSRAAAAKNEPAGGVTGGAVPLSITDTALQSAIDKAVEHYGTAAGLLLTIKCSTNKGDIGIDSTGESGWFGALLFPDTNDTFEVLLTDGYSGSLYVGQILKMNSGNMSGPTLKGVDARIERCTDQCGGGCTWDNYKQDCPRIVYIPVVTTQGDDLGNNYVKITSFAAFFLEGYGGSGSDSYIQGRYLPGVQVQNTVGGTSSEDFGVYVSKLTD